MRLSDHADIVGIDFVTLKLAGLVDWSIWLVLSPFAVALLFRLIQWCARAAAEGEARKRKAELMDAVERGIKLGQKAGG